MVVKRLLLILLYLVFPAVVFSASELTFDSSGRVEKLVLGDQDFLSGAAGGFTLRYSDGGKEQEVRLTKISVSRNRIRAAHPAGKPSFTFQVDPYPNHVAVHLLDAQGIGSGHGYSLSLDLGTSGVTAYTLNDYMTVKGGKRRDSTKLNWPYLWGWPRPNGTRGSAVIYKAGLEVRELDGVLAEIWSVQGTLGHMVRPAGHKTWTKDDVMAWVRRWVEKFETMAVVCIAAKSEEELYAMTDKLVIPTGANRVYMFSTDWRGEYTIRKLRNESVAADAFPNGKESLLNYSAYLARHGAHLQLKSLVPHMGHEDPRYFTDSHCETRLLSWGKGTLLKDIEPGDTTILFKPGPEHIWERESVYLRIGTELIRSHEVSVDADKGVWTFKQCERGQFATTAKPHRAGAAIDGIMHSYGYVHFADDYGRPDSLAEEVLQPYGEFLNEVNVGHLHFDGTYSRFPECPWYLRNYTDYLYAMMDQPVTGSKVGGTIPANFERMFSIAERADQATGYWGIRIGPRLWNMARGEHKEKRDFAPSIMDMHFDIADRILLGGRRPNLTAGKSGGALSMNIIENYGLLDEALELYRDWMVLAPVYDDADVDYIKSLLQRPPRRSHYVGEDVPVLGKNEAGEFIYTPHRVMGRTSGEDEPYSVDQEWGGVPRCQRIKAGTAMELYNPYEEQLPQVVIFVEKDSPALTDPLIKVNGGGLKVTGEIQPTEYMKFEGGNNVTVYDANWNELRTLPAAVRSFIFKEGNNTVTTASGSGSEKPELRVQYITCGPVYVLESNKHISGTAGRASGFVCQAEEMELKGYKIGKSAAAAGGKYIATAKSGIAGKKFPGAAGVYTVSVQYFDEADGQSKYGLRVDGRLAASWTADASKGSSGVSAASLCIKVIPDVSLKNGSLIEVGSTADESEYGTLDQIIIRPSAE